MSEGFFIGTFEVRYYGIILMLGAVGAGLTSEYIPAWFGPTADVTTIENTFGRLWLFIYFACFAALWAYTYFGWEKTKPVPERVTTHD